MTARMRQGVFGADSYGTAEIRKLDDGRCLVVWADDVIGISVELLNEAVGAGLHVDEDGLLCLAGDARYRYQPVRFVHHRHLDGKGARVLVCRRVGVGA
jgi:hypothetical protein